MNKIWILGLLIILVTYSATADGIYFDVGMGIGSANTSIDNYDVADYMDSSVEEVGVELGLKLGYGPVLGVPLYIVGEFGGIGHRFSDDYNYLQFNSYLIGPGIIFYPVPLIQLAASVGFSTVANDTDITGVELYGSESGVAGNISAAFDFGKKNHGLLLGMKYFVTNNTLEISGAEQESSIFDIFLRYAYRHKMEK